MNKFTNRIHQLNKLINEVAHPDDVEVDLVIENDEQLDEKAPPRPRNAGKRGPRYNTIYGGGDKLADREPAPTNKETTGFNNRKKIHVADLKDKLKNRNVGMGGVYVSKHSGDVKDAKEPGGFKKLSKKLPK